MRILLQPPRDTTSQWHASLAAALPQAAITLWPELDERPDYALVWKPPAELFGRVRPKRAIFNLGAGVDALIGVPTLPDDVPVIRIEDAGMAEQMAEYVALAVLSAFREANAYSAQQREALWKPRPRLDKARFAVGILGFGVLGTAVARALGPLGFPLLAWSRTRKGDGAVVSFAGTAELHAFLARARMLVCLLPATPDTRGLLDRAALARLPRGAHVVNVARGDIIVDGDLLALIDDGHLGGATLDVFRDEPLPAAHPFWHHPRITVTPHVSAVTLVDASVAQVAAKIARLERGEPVSGVVDRGRGY